MSVDPLVGLPTGSTDIPKPKYVRPVREPELWTGEPPQSTDGKIPMNYSIQKRCGIEDIDQKTGKKIKCNQRLQVTRVKNQVFEKDESGFGGQLMYKEDDVRQYVLCPIHLGLPKDWHKWEPGTKL